MANQEQFLTDETIAVFARLMADDSVLEARRRPGFAEASRNIVKSWRAPDSAEDKAFAHFLRDLGRYIGGTWALYLDATPGGLSVGRLADLLAWTRVASASRARSIMLYLQFIGYIAPMKRAGDNRIKLFAPTPRLKDAFRNRLHREFAAMAHMHPAIAASGPLISDDDAFSVYSEFMGEAFLAYLSLRQETGPSLEMFSQRYSGMMLLGELLATAAPDDVFPPKGPLRYTVADLGRRCGISRTQVRKLLKEAETAGFLRLAEEGVAMPTDLLGEHLEMAHAGQIMGCIWCCERLLARMGRPV